MTLEKIYHENYEYITKHPQKILKTISNTIENKSAKGKILSIGCGEADFEQSLVRKGYQVYGIDLNKKALKNAEKKGIISIHGDFYKQEFTEKFDFILTIDMIEHAQDPAEFIRKAKELLKEKGVLIIKSPNFGHIKYRIKYLKNGTIGTIQQLSYGHFAHLTLKEVMEIVKGFKLKNVKHVNFSYNRLHNLLANIWPNLFSLSTIIIAEK